MDISVVKLRDMDTARVKPIGPIQVQRHREGHICGHKYWSIDTLLFTLFVMWTLLASCRLELGYS